MQLKTRLLIAGIIGVGLVLVYGPGFIRWAELRGQRVNLQTEVASLEQENQRLIDEAARLQEDPSYAEIVARQEMGFVREGEHVVKLQD